MIAGPAAAAALLARIDVIVRRSRMGAMMFIVVHPDVTLNESMLMKQLNAAAETNIVGRIRMRRVLDASNVLCKLRCPLFFR